MKFFEMSQLGAFLGSLRVDQRVGREGGAYRDRFLECQRAGWRVSSHDSD